MSRTREDVQNVIKTACEWANKAADAGVAWATEDEVQFVDRLMQLPALRLAEKAEEHYDWTLAVVDNGTQLMAYSHDSKGDSEHVFRHMKDYRKVIEVAGYTEVRK